LSKDLEKIEKENRKLNEKNEKMEAKRIHDNEAVVEHKKKEEIKAPIRARHRELNEAPVRPLLEEIGNSVTHGVGAIFAVVAFILMITRASGWREITSAIVYGDCMFFMMLMSCLYHAFPCGSTVKRIWRRFDYTSIYLLIGGTFAPLLLVFFGNPEYQEIFKPNFGYEGFYSVFGVVFFIVQWVLIITGITMVCVFGPGRIKWLNFPLYFLIGWAGLMFIPLFIESKEFRDRMTINFQHLIQLFI